MVIRAAPPGEGATLASLTQTLAAARAGLPNFAFRVDDLLFFAFDPVGRAGSRTDAQAAEWTALRNRWEYSHVARAGFGIVSLVALVVALV